MSHIKIKKPWDVEDKELTPESVYMRRREFLKGTALVTAATIGAFYGCNSGPLPDPEARVELTDLEKTIYPAKLNPRFTEDHLDRSLTDEKVAASFNNFYEFSSNKVDPRRHAQRLVLRPWAVEVSGLVHKPRTFDIDDLLRTMPIEERMYRFRCVEAWAMSVPWTGFPLKALLDLVEPQAKATHVRMTTFYLPMTAQEQLKFWYPWPYTEGMTIAEASNELTFMATGLYGHPLPKQNGAPVRLVVPWKYGFKNIKSVVKIELTASKPETFWNTLIPHEYDFVANVDPRVPHPRWSQAQEKLIGTEAVRPTIPFNGYGNYVAKMYA